VISQKVVTRLKLSFKIRNIKSEQFYFHHLISLICFFYTLVVLMLYKSLHLKF